MKKNKNNILLIVLLALIAVFVLTKVFRSPARESNLDTDLFGIDTAQISSIRLTRQGKPELTLKKNDGVWTVSQDTKIANVEKPAVDNLIRSLSELKPERIVSRKSERWDSYLVGDTTSLHLTAYDPDEEEVLDWRVGKESQGMTYVRPEGEDEVYAMEGLFRSRIDRDFNGWRDKTFLRIEAGDVVGITFKYPSDSGFVLRRDGRRWMVDNQQADSASVLRYINKLQSRNFSNIVDDFSPAAEPDVTVTIQNTSQQPAIIKAWKGPQDSWTLNSSLQEGVYFRDATLVKDLFVRKSSLVAK